MSITLTSTDSLKLLLTTSSASSIDVVISYAEITASGITGKNALLKINSATSTEILGTPPAGTQIAIKEITARNTGNSLNVAKFRITAPFDRPIYNAFLNPGDMAEWTESVGWRLINSAGTPVDLMADPPVFTQVFDTPGTFTWKKPTTFRPKMIKVTMWGGGGGGGGGRGFATGPKRGGTGGGGGAFNESMFLADEVPDAVTVIVGAGGAGGAGGIDTTGTGSYGTPGGYSRFGEFVMAGGGGGGAWGDVASITSGGSGGGRLGSGMNGLDSNFIALAGGGPYAAFGGQPGTAVQFDGVGGQGGSALGAGTGNNAEYGGAGGGGQAAAGTTYTGGSSIYGGAGGGCGGSSNSGGTTVTQPAAGGRNDGIWGTGGGGGAAGVSGIVSTPGFDGAAGVGRRGGAGGGGGGSSVTAYMSGKHGGNGGARGGGGGGGGGALSSYDTKVGGDGGNGGRGEVIVTVW